MRLAVGVNADKAREAACSALHLAHLKPFYYSNTGRLCGVPQDRIRDGARAGQRVRAAANGRGRMRNHRFAGQSRCTARQQRGQNTNLIPQQPHRAGGQVFPAGLGPGKDGAVHERHRIARTGQKKGGRGASWPCPDHNNVTCTV